MLLTRSYVCHFRTGFRKFLVSDLFFVTFFRFVAKQRGLLLSTYCKLMGYPIGKAKLVYAKSKVYVHPTKHSKDNVPGFVYLLKENDIQTDKDIVFGWCSESNLDSDQLKTLEKVDLLRGDTKGSHYIKNPSRYGSFSFAVTINELFSFQIRPPSLGWWYGSIVINTRSSMDKLPVLFFHDDECPSTVQELDYRKKQFEIFNDENELFWGGLQFLTEFKKYANLEKSTLERSIFLINPTLEDLNNFSPTNTVDESKQVTNFTKPNLNKLLNDAKWSVLETLAKFTTFTKRRLDDVHIDPNIVPFLSNPEVTKINEEFDTARVYLAKWAMGVQEEAYRNRSKIILDQNSRDLLQKELGLNFDRLLPEEVLQAHERSRELAKKEWELMFDSTGRLNITVNEVKNRIFHGGVNDEIRHQVWLFILGVYPWDSSKHEREDIKIVLDQDYENYKSQWVDNQELQEQDEYFKDQVFRIEKDIQRTDRTLPEFQRGPEEQEDDGLNDNLVVKNPNLVNMREILITFNQYNKFLGYVQGMNDLLSPLYLKLHEESTGLVFWSFVKFMDRMERNFLHDQSGIKDQMNALNELTQFLLPDLYIHLEKCDSSNLFFFFRMLLVWFKREFPMNDIFKLWEVLWLDYYSSQFHLFIALAVLQKHEKIIINHLKQFDEVLKYMNDLSMTFDLNDLLTRAELLFLKFRKMIEIIDKENKDDDRISPISENLRLLLSKELVIKREKERFVG